MVSVSAFGVKLANSCITIALVAITVAAFTKNPILSSKPITSTHRTYSTQAEQTFSSSSPGHLYNQFESWRKHFLSFVTKPKQQSKSPSKQKSKTGTIIRCAARSFQNKASEPTSPQYTTRKDLFPSITITPSGVVNDYNHYRTKALSSTPDRAISILTYDTMQYLQQQSSFTSVQNGDLGENVLVDGVSYDYFKLHQTYRLGKDVILEITEPIVPCANLCKLEFINRGGLEPKKRIEKCKQFLETLGVKDGVRGWYAKVVGGGGVVKVGDEVVKLGIEGNGLI